MNLYLSQIMHDGAAGCESGSPELGPRLDRDAEPIDPRWLGGHAGREDAWRALDTVIRLLEPVNAQAVQPLRALAHAVRYGYASGRRSSSVARGLR